MNSSSGFLALFFVFCLAGELNAGIKTPAQRLREKDESGEDGVCSAKCDLTQNEDILSLKENVTRLSETVQDLRNLFNEVSNHHSHHHDHQNQNRGSTGQLVDNLVSGVQRPLHDVADNLNSDYFPFPENSDRPVEHFGTGSTNQGSGQHHGSGGHGGAGGGSGSTHSHGQHTQGASGRSGDCSGGHRHPAAFLKPARFRNTEEFDFALCRVRPNSALSPDHKENVHGMIILSQKKNSNLLIISLRLSGFNVTEGHGEEEHSENIHETQQEGSPFQKFAQETIKGGDFTQQSQHQTDATSGHFHGFHVHEKADLSNGCDSTGAHYNPYKLRHGSPVSRIRHVGDFGNIDCDDEGSTNLIITDETASLRGQYSIIGKPLVIHAKRDDLGVLPNDPGSSTTGNSGARVACCVIERIPSSLYNEGKFAQSEAAGNKRPETRRENIKNPHQDHHA